MYKSILSKTTTHQELTEEEIFQQYQSENLWFETGRWRPTEALPLLSMVRPPYRSCIVTGGTPEKVIGLAASLRPALVQLHFKETLADTMQRQVCSGERTDHPSAIRCGC